MEAWGQQRQGLGCKGQEGEGGCLVTAAHHVGPERERKRETRSAVDDSVTIRMMSRRLEWGRGEEL